MKEHAHAPRTRTGHSAPQPRIQLPEGAFGALIPEIQRAVAAEGYVTPTPIQEQCIGHLLEGRDLLGSAQTGTGKTAAFALPLLQRLSGDSRRFRKGTPRALILAPTRELAAQIGESVRTYGRFLRLSHIVIFGGVNQFHQVEALNRGVDILVATPGRLLDLMQQGHIHLNEVEVFILDEGDRMLDMGFIPDIKRVLSHIPDGRQTLFFSATLPAKMVKLAHTMVRNPVRVTIAPDEPAVESIAQKVLFVGKKNKDALLISLLSDPQIDKVLVFTQMKHAANNVVKKLSKAGIEGAAIHGNKSQPARTKALDGFKKGRFRVLVATDVAARGLDVDDITHVINYDLPVEAETYVHRIGRTARAGASGDAISFCCAEERAYLREIERLLGKPVPAEMKHAYHCDKAFQSNQPAPKNFGRGGGGGRPRGNSARPRGRKRGRGMR
ncbi:MAG: DEAD/DEAH box helicase [Candidatus Latescibacteria bacterium]|nr:DEAD/DEAH box helicase [Candidatus Latescibacterota bacterium]MCK5381144.1 DEAD/DEAH box helicase [Candidatus Latescibacterota bacterium]